MVLNVVLNLVLNSISCRKMMINIMIREGYSEPCKISKMERFSKIVSLQRLLIIFTNAPSYLFDRVLNTAVDNLHSHYQSFLKLFKKLFRCNLSVEKSCY